MPDPDLEAAIGAIAGRYFGKYRGEVVDNADPTSRGRLLVKATSVMGDTELWAMPCVPYAGDQVGFFALPPVGAKVWIEFEGGDTDYPIWTGCFWTDGQIPTGDAEPHIAFFKTDGVTIRVDGQSGSVDIETSGGAKITMSSQEIKLEAPQISQSANGGTADLSAAGFDAMGGALKVL